MAQGAVGDAVQEAAELHGQALVQVHAAPQLQLVLRTGVLAEQVVHGIAGDEVQEQEDQHHRPAQGEEAAEQALQEEAAQVPGPGEESPAQAKKAAQDRDLVEPCLHSSYGPETGPIVGGKGAQ